MEIAEDEIVEGHFEILGDGDEFIKPRVLSAPTLYSAIPKTTIVLNTVKSKVLFLSTFLILFTSSDIVTSHNIQRTERSGKQSDIFGKSCPLCPIAGNNRVFGVVTALSPAFSAYIQTDKKRLSF